jgi:hypothetical protein
MHGSTRRREETGTSRASTSRTEPGASRRPDHLAGLGEDDRFQRRAILCTTERSSLVWTPRSVSSVTTSSVTSPDTIRICVAIKCSRRPGRGGTCARTGPRRATTAEPAVPGAPRRAGWSIRRGLVAHLVAVARRALDYVPTPSLRHARDLGKLVTEPRGHQHSRGSQHPCVGQSDRKPSSTASTVPSTSSKPSNISSGRAPRPGRPPRKSTTGRRCRRCSGRARPRSGRGRRRTDCRLAGTG